MPVDLSRHHLASRFFSPPGLYRVLTQRRSGGHCAESAFFQALLCIRNRDGQANITTIRDLIGGPWRAVLVLGITQNLAWGAIFYPPVLTVPTK